MEVGEEEKENSFPVLSGACWLFFHPLSGGGESAKPGCEKWSSERGGIGCKKNRVAKERKLKGSPFFSDPGNE